MALTYADSAALMNDMEFRGRVKVSVLKFADYIASEAPTTAGHNSRYKWAQQAFASPDQTAFQVQPAVVMDPAVQVNGSAISDSALQSAVEGVINKIL